MPFIASDKTTGERVDISRYSSPKIDLLRKELVCPVCGMKMMIKQGFFVSAHFAHVANDRCPYAEYSAGESVEHREAKLWLVDELRTRFADLTAGELVLEHHFPEAGRIADVAVVLDCGYAHAYEIQLASITIESLEKRTRSYNGAGIDVTWFIGGKADTPANRQWIEKEQGELLLIEMHYAEVTDYVPARS